LQLFNKLPISIDIVIRLIPSGTINTQLNLQAKTQVLSKCLVHTTTVFMIRFNTAKNVLYDLT